MPEYQFLVSFCHCIIKACVKRNEGRNRYSNQSSTYVHDLLHLLLLHAFGEHLLLILGKAVSLQNTVIVSKSSVQVDQGRS